MGGVEEWGVKNKSGVLNQDISWAGLCLLTFESTGAHFYIFKSKY